MALVSATLTSGTPLSVWLSPVKPRPRTPLGAPTTVLVPCARPLQNRVAPAVVAAGLNPSEPKLAGVVRSTWPGPNTASSAAWENWAIEPSCPFS